MICYHYSFHPSLNSRKLWCVISNSINSYSLFLKDSAQETCCILLNHYKFPSKNYWAHNILFLQLDELNKDLSQCLLCLKLKKLIGWSKIIFLVSEFIVLMKSVSSFLYIQFSSVAQSCLTLRDPMNHSTPGLPVHHQLQEFTQTHIHRVSDAIQPSHPLSSPSPPAPNPSQHQSLFQWVNSSHEVTKVLEFQL